MIRRRALERIEPWPFSFLVITNIFSKTRSRITAHASVSHTKSKSVVCVSVPEFWTRHIRYVIQRYLPILEVISRQPFSTSGGIVSVWSISDLRPYYLKT